MTSGTDVHSRRGRWKLADWRRRRPGVPTAGALRQAVLELVFPPACVSCRTAMDADHAAGPGLRLCRCCLQELVLIGGPTCRQCGAPAPEALGAVERCVRCGRRKLWFDEAIALGQYTGRLRQMLLQMKQAAGNPTSLALAELIWQRCGGRLQAASPDLVVPIPMHWQRRWTHGTNSASLLAESLARRLQVPLGRWALRRRRNTPRQFSLPPTERWPNVRRAFVARRSHRLRGAHVLLVDDILTTGATCSEAARTLKRSGADRVTVVVVARALRD